MKSLKTKNVQKLSKSTCCLLQLPLKWVLVLVLALLTAPAYASLQIFACEPEWGALAHELAGDQAQVYIATSNRQDPHHIQARPSLIAHARRADLLVCTGAELETGWLPVLLKKSGNPHIQQGENGYFMAAEQVALLEKPTRLDRSQGDVHSMGNPHIQLDPRRILVVAKALSQRLQEVDPDHAEFYESKWKQFEQAWNQVMQDWKQQASTLQGARVVVHHDSWIYLRDWLGLKQVATLEPLPGVPPTSSHLANVLRKLKKEPADWILRASYQDARPAQWLASRTGLPVRVVDFSPNRDENLQHWFERVLKQLQGQDAP